MITKPVRLELLEEGRLVDGLNEDLARATKALIDHVQEYGVEATTKSKAKITLEITLAPVNAADGTFAYSAKVKTSLPGRPAYATTAILDRDALDGNKQTLFVRASGGDDGDPRQMRLSTDDGRAIDPATQEPRNKREGGAK